MVNEKDICWAAGFFDGEGCISIVKDLYAVHHGFGRNPIYVIQTCVVNNDFDSTLVFQELFGGSIYKSKIHESYRWIPGKNEVCKNFLLTILPHLITKRRQANLALQFLELPHGSSLRKDLLKEKEDIYLRMRELNGFSTKGRKLKYPR